MKAITEEEIKKVARKTVQDGVELINKEERIIDKSQAIILVISAASAMYEDITGNEEEAFKLTDEAVEKYVNK